MDSLFKRPSPLFEHCSAVILVQQPQSGNLLSGTKGCQSCCCSVWAVWLFSEVGRERDTDCSDKLLQKSQDSIHFPAIAKKMKKKKNDPILQFIRCLFSCSRFGALNQYQYETYRPAPPFFQLLFHPSEVFWEENHHYESAIKLNIVQTAHCLRIVVAFIIKQIPPILPCPMYLRVAIIANCQQALCVQLRFHRRAFTVTAAGCWLARASM